MSKTTERLERLKKQEEQLKARIQQEQARISASARKERDGKLIAGAWPSNNCWRMTPFRPSGGNYSVNGCFQDGRLNKQWLGLTQLFSII